ncbi:MAG: hypothetical protein JWO59_1741 [Chloroflexi bacterium]|nr:hypothetical protein [Chloroflexota bacterium]MDB5075877.1 hypothetical protein [Chloroflexota bacterium]
MPPVILDLPYRASTEPPPAHVDAETPSDMPTVVLTARVPGHCWDHGLHLQRAQRLKAALHLPPQPSIPARRAR